MENDRQLVSLVDLDDNEIGVAEKLQAHRDGGLLHRAFSIFLINDRSELLLQRRAPTKYHCPGMWSNSCCSHPRPGRDLFAEAGLRLRVEIGVASRINHIGTISYKLPMDNGLTEWELDHIFIGRYSGAVAPNPEEADAVQWISFHDLKSAMRGRSRSFTPWLPAVFRKVLEYCAKTDTEQDLQQKGLSFLQERLCGAAPRESGMI